MRKISVFAFVMVLFASVAYSQAQPVTPGVPVSPAIPTPPGAKLITEINMTENDLLGMVKQGIEGFAQGAEGSKGELGQALKAIDLSTLSEAIQGIRAVRAMQFTLAPKTAPDQIFGFYEQQFTLADGWTRVLYDSSMAKGSVMAVYTRGGQEYLSVGVDTKQNRVYAVRTVGTVDVPKLAAWIGKTAKYASDMEAKYSPKPIKPTTKKPVLKKQPIRKK